MVFDIRFRTSFNCIVNGPTGSGKTTFVKNLLEIKSLIFDNEPKKVILYYSIMQNIYTEMKNEGLIDELVQVDQAFPTYDEIVRRVHPYKDDGGSLLIFDDMVTQLTADFEKIFLNVSHHEKASVIFMTQNLFYNDKVYRTISLNSHYIVLMKSHRDKQQVSILARQICPGNSKYIVGSYEDATKKPYTYLICDFRPDTPSAIRVRSSIFSHEIPCVTYLET